MKAAWYERNGAAHDVLTVGDMETPEPGPGEVRVKITVSGVNPSDVKSRRGRPLSWPRIIPHSDGAGVIDAVGEGVGHRHVGERVWLWNAQWKRAFGTAAEYCVPGGRAGGQIAQPRRDRGRRLPRHPGAHRPAGGPAAWPDRRQDLARHRGRIGGRPLRDADRQGARRPGDRHRIRGKGRPRAQRRRRLRHRLQEEGCRQGHQGADARRRRRRHHRHGPVDDGRTDRRRRRQAARHDRLLRLEQSRRHPDLVPGDAVQQLCAQDLPRLRAQAGRSPRGNPGAHDAAQGRYCSSTASARISGCATSPPRTRPSKAAR